jgi:hypothetical protein
MYHRNDTELYQLNQYETVPKKRYETVSTEQKAMMTTTEPVYDMAQLDKVKGEISSTKFREATNQIASILTLQHCGIDESKGHGHAWIMLSKNGVTAIVSIPIKPAAFAGTTSADKFIYKAALKNYTEYKTHCKGAIKMIKACSESN